LFATLLDHSIVKWSTRSEEACAVRRDSKTSTTAQYWNDDGNLQQSNFGEGRNGARLRQQNTYKVTTVNIPSYNGLPHRVPEYRTSESLSAEAPPPLSHLRHGKFSTLRTAFHACILAVRHPILASLQEPCTGLCASCTALVV
jgi:hypothetical protein